MYDNEENIEFDWVIPENASNNENDPDWVIPENASNNENETDRGFFYLPYLISLILYELPYHT